MEKMELDAGTHESVSVTPIFKEKELWVLILLGILYFYQPLFTHDTFFFRDLYAHFLPQRHLLVEVIKRGELPLWDPYVHGGQPLLGDVQNLVLYPTSLLYFVLPLLTAFNVEIVLHVILCSVATYLLARVLKLSPLAAFVAGIVYAYCGYTLSLANVMNRLLAMPYLPLALLFWHQFLNEHRWRWFSFTVLAGVFQIFAGAPEMTLITFGFLLLWSAVHPYPVSLPRRFLFWFLLIFFIAGISSVQVLPGLEMAGQSSRSEPGSYKVFAGWSLNPGRLPELFISNFLGYTYGMTNGVFWGSRLEDKQFPYILSIYFGSVTLLLAATAPFLKGVTALSYRLRLLLLFMLIASILLSCGRYLPFFNVFYNTAFLINRFRYPIKFLVAAVLPVALLAALFMEACFSSASKQKNALLLFWISSAGLALLSGTLLLSAPLLKEFLDSYFGISTAPVQQGFREALLHAVAISFAATFLLQFHYLKPGRWQPWVFAGLITLDLFYAGAFINSYAPSEFFTDKPALAGLVAGIEKGGRFLRCQDPKTIVLKMPANDILYVYRWDQETLYNYIGAYYGIQVIYHQDYDGLGKKEIQRLAAFVYSAPWENRGPILNMSGITAIFSADELNLPGLISVAKIRTSSNTKFYLYRNVNSPRVRFVSRIKPAASREAAFQAVTSPGFDPAKEVVLLQSPEGIAPSDSCGPATIEQTSSRINRSAFHANIPCNGMLVFAEPFYPGWEIQVDGKPAETMEANYAFSAIRIGAGSHTIERAYKPKSFRNGLALSILFTTVLVSTPFLRGLRGRKTRRQ